ncbi:MAG: hypothetical protein ACYCTZ_08460 [Candidatus Dormibacteria bacterium]
MPDPSPDIRAGGTALIRQGEGSRDRPVVGSGDLLAREVADMSWARR